MLLGDKGLLINFSMSLIKSIVVWDMGAIFFSAFCSILTADDFLIGNALFDRERVEYFSEFRGLIWLDYDEVHFQDLSIVWLLALLLESSFDSKDTLLLIAFEVLYTLRVFGGFSFILISGRPFFFEMIGLILLSHLGQLEVVLLEAEEFLDDFQVTFFFLTNFWLLMTGLF